jgi:hypothetical protein
MKISRLLALIAAFLLTSSIGVFAQNEKMPDDIMSIGVFANGAYGGTVGYVLQQNIHIGAQVGFQYVGGNDTEESKTYMYFTPYCKYFMETIKYFSPFIMGAFQISSIPKLADNQGNESKIKYSSSTSTSLLVAVGGEWFPYKSVGVFGGFEFVKYDFDNSQFYAGLGQAFIGIEWFLQ